MLVVLTRPQADLYRLLLRLTKGGAAVYRGCLGRERGMRTAVSGTLASLADLGVVGIISHGRGRCREIRVLKMPDYVVEVPNPPMKGHMLRTIGAWRDGGMDDAAVWERLSTRVADNDDAAMAVG